MLNCDNSVRNASIGMLAGGTIGAITGAHFAPNALGKIDIEKALTRSVYTDIVHDKIEKLGNAGSYLFVRSRDNWFNELKKIDSYTNELLPGKKDHNGIIDCIIERKSSVSGKELKDLLKGKGEDKFSEWAIDIAKKYKEAIEKLSDDVVLSKEKLYEFLKKENSVYKNSKKVITEYIDALPKQKGKYAAIFGSVGAILSALFVSALTPRKTEIVQK